VVVVVEGVWRREGGVDEGVEGVEGVQWCRECSGCRECREWMGHYPFFTMLQ
jgi:hypothetical protein